MPKQEDVNYTLNRQREGGTAKKYSYANNSVDTCPTDTFQVYQKLDSYANISLAEKSLYSFTFVFFTLEDLSIFITI